MFTRILATVSMIVVIAAGGGLITNGLPGSSGHYPLVHASGAPTVTSVSPEDGALDVSVLMMITANFSGPMDASTINTTSFTLVTDSIPVTGSVSYDSDTYTATFTQDTHLDYAHVYTANLSTDIKDEAGNPLAEAYTWSFTTASSPVPPIPHAFYGGLTVNGSPAPVGTVVEARGEGVRTGIEGNPLITTEVGRYGSPGIFEEKLVVQGYIKPGTTIYFYINGNKANETYPFSSGNVTELDLTLIDTTPPTVASTSPEADATGVTVDTTVNVTFNEAMAASSINTTSFTLVTDSIPVAGSISYDIGTYSATFTPSANLAYNTTYNATLNKDITDAAGNPLATAYSWSFTTKALVSIDITPENPSIAAGGKQQFTATGTGADNTTLDITNDVTWSSSNTTVATIDTAGLATSYAEGTTVITATLGEISDNTTLTVDNTPPAVTIGLSEPTDSIAVTVSSNEALAAAPIVIINPAITMTQIGVNKWRGTYGSTGSPITDGQYTVTANATDKAGNATIRTATFCKQTVTISENETKKVSTGTTTLEIQTTANVTNASISVTQHNDNPSGNIGNPGGAERAAGVFVEIVASPELRDNLEQIYIQVNYDPSELSADTDESTLKLYLWDLTSGTWQVVPGSGVNTDEHYIYGTITHLSKYGGFGTVAAQAPPPPAPAPTPPATPTGGGGGGGGVSPGYTNITEYITSTGRFTKEVIAKSFDGKVELSIPKDTIGLNRVGQPLYYVSIKEQPSPPDPPEDCQIMGLVYDFGPTGTTFNPPASLTYIYNTDDLPEGVNEENLVIAHWDTDAGEWIILEGCVVDTVNHTVTAPISRFSQYAFLAYTKPAAFNVSDLTITPVEVSIGNEVTISVLVANTGDLTGSYEVGFEMDDTVVQSKEIVLYGGVSQTVTFTTVKDVAGTYAVNVDGRSGTFIVTQPAPPAPSPAPPVKLPAPPPAPVKPPAPPPEPPASPAPALSPAPVLPSATNWGLIVGIIFGCIVVAGLLVYFLVWRKRGASRPSQSTASLI
jgi:hypothetical protein